MPHVCGLITRSGPSARVRASRRGSPCRREAPSASPPAASPPCRSPARTPSTGTAISPASASASSATDARSTFVQSRGPAGLHRVTLGPCAGVAIDKRRREAATIIDRIKRGLDPVPPEPEPEPTVADLAARCMHAYVKVHCKPKTEEALPHCHRPAHRSGARTMAVKDVRLKDVIALHDRLRNTPSMANHVVAMLSKMFSLAETWDVVPRGRNPCKAVSHYREQPRERFLTPEEYRSVGAALREAEAGGWMWRPAIAAMRLLMLTGCRKSEIPHPALGRRGPHVGRVPAPRRQAGPAHGAADDAGSEGARRHRTGRRQSLGHSEQEARRLPAGSHLLLEPHPGARRAERRARP